MDGATIGSIIVAVIGFIVAVLQSRGKAKEAALLAVVMQGVEKVGSGTPVKKAIADIAANKGVQDALAERVALMFPKSKE